MADPYNIDTDPDLGSEKFVTDPDPGNDMDSTDPDPQHCCTLTSGLCTMPV